MSENNTLMNAPWLGTLARVFRQGGQKLYLVGGAVRNPLMGLPVSDYDVCGPARPEEVCELCQDTCVRAVMRAAHFGTVELHVTDDDGVHHMAEYTTWRKDSYRCGHRPEEVTFTDDIEVDALRRDFSVNALYQRVYETYLGEVIDPTGGLKHLEKKVLRTVTFKPDQVLSEDGLRILRAIRFQGELYMKPTDGLVKCLAKYAHLLADIAPERMRDEVQKIIMADLRYPSINRRRSGTLDGLAMLRDCGGWAYVFGEDIPYDEVSVFGLVRLLELTFPARMAMLLNHVGPEKAQACMQRLRFSASDTQQVVRTLQVMQNPKAPTLELLKLGKPAMGTAMRIFGCKDDLVNFMHLFWLTQELQSKPASLAELAVNGDDLTPIFERTQRPMKEMGAVLEALWRATLEDGVPNTRDELLALAQSGQV